jgi:ketosteroid isomerase-like protein
MTTSLGSPQAVIESFERLLADRDVDGLLALYEPRAAFQTPAGTLTGHDAIRGALTEFVALEPSISGEIVKVVEADGTALLVNRWALEGRAPDGAPVRMAGTSADVMRRQSDGTWRILVDDPWGAGTAAAGT